MSRRLVILGLLVVGVLIVIGWATLGRAPSKLSAPLRARLDIASDRMQKTDLIQQLTSPPEVIILGGSRALRFDPAYLQERTGLSGFNAAVTGARPEDAWALVSLLHARFPRARFRFSGSSMPTSSIPRRSIRVWCTTPPWRASSRPR